jgi:DeoR/GlpR family transcriptional regulator of sugar metabolism
MASYLSITELATLSTATVQSGLDGLPERNLVRRESRGAYALADQGYAEWVRHRRWV